MDDTKFTRQQDAHEIVNLDSSLKQLYKCLLTSWKETKDDQIDWLERLSLELVALRSRG